MFAYEIMCAGIEKPICLARSGMVAISSHVSRDPHDFVATVRISWLSCLILSASTCARWSACPGVTGMYDLSSVYVGGSCAVGSCSGVFA